MNPDISYVVSNYNSADYLIGLLDDLLNQQSHKNIEVIVVDSNSTDDSVQCVREHDDPRLRLIVQPERTPYGVSWAEGWRAASGKIVANSNTDDRSYPWRGTQVLISRGQAKRPPAMGRPRPYHFYYGGYETWRDGICVARGAPPEYSEQDMAEFFRCGVHVHWDNDIRNDEDFSWERVYKAGYEYKSAFDYWLVLYLISLDAYGVAIPSCFSVYNQREDSLEQSDKERNTFESIRAIREFYPKGKVALDFLSKTRLDNPEFYERYQQFVKQYD